jgi:hypothetical protein
MTRSCDAVRVGAMQLGRVDDSEHGLYLEIRAINPGDKAALAAAVDQSSGDAV